MNRKMITVALVTLALTASACGGKAATPAKSVKATDKPAASATASPSPPVVVPVKPPPVNYKVQYLRLVTPGNAAFIRFNRLYVAAGCVKHCSFPAYHRALDKSGLIKEITMFNNALLRAPWPANALQDIHALAKANAAEAAALSADQPTAADINAANSASSIAANIVRADLGLPPNQ